MTLVFCVLVGGAVWSVLRLLNSPRHPGLRLGHRLPLLIQPSPKAPALELVIDSQKKVVMGRPDSNTQVERVASEVGPILADAIEQESIQPLIRQDAAASHESVAAFKEYFIHKQEADILLESGGDPNAVSSASAGGVAQWLGGTARSRGGLRVDEFHSNRITREIDAAAEEIRQLEAQPSDFIERLPANAPLVANTDERAAGAGGTFASASAAGPGGTVASASSVGAGGPALKAWGRDELIAWRRQQIRDLIARRRSIDERFDPRAALFAQTRYLLWMWNKYPSLDWVFEAYHGGEGAVQRTLQTFLGTRWKLAGSVANAISGKTRSGGSLGPTLSYSDVFFATSPRSHPETFSYLYGLHDEHRTYWFKVLMAEQAIAWFRRDSRSFADECEALRPGYPIEDAWYPDAPANAYSNMDAIASAVKSGELTPLTRVSIPGAAWANLPIFREGQQEAAARPEALGALKKVAATYRQESRKPGALMVVAMTQPTEEVEALRALYPSPPPRTPLEPGFPAADNLPDLHANGLAIDILKPSDPWEQRVLQFALDYWEDRERIHFNSKLRGGKWDAWRIIPNPNFRQELLAEVGSPQPSSGDVPDRP